MIVTEEDRRWVSQNYPQLKFSQECEIVVLEGSFDFVAAYVEQEDRYVINPNEPDASGLKIIRDSYEVKITLHNEKSVLPKVQEVGGRIKSVAETHGMQLADLHIYPDNTLCMVGPFDGRIDLTLPQFLDGPVLQTFYDQSYFEKYGRWIRGQYSHGILGLIENYYDRILGGEDLADECLARLWASNSRNCLQILTMKAIIDGHHRCICGSGERFRRCHKKVLFGLQRLQEYIRQRPTLRNKITLFCMTTPSVGDS